MLIHPASYSSPTNTSRYKLKCWPCHPRRHIAFVYPLCWKTTDIWSI